MELEFPVYIHKEGDSLPNDQIYYLVTSNGIYLYKNLGTVRSLTTVNGPINFLGTVERFAELKFPIIPRNVIGKFVSFFKYVYNNCSSESAALLLYFPRLKEYAIHCPIQNVSSGSVEWKNEDETFPAGSILAGSFHCHGNGLAFHSTTDIGDERKFDGIHVTIGHINQENPSLMASIVINGDRFRLNREKTLSHLDIEILEDENENVGIISSGSMYEDYQSTLYSHHAQNDITVKRSNSWKNYSLKLSDNEFYFHCTEGDFPDEWKEKYIHKEPNRYYWDGTKLVQCSSRKDKDRSLPRYDWKKWSKCHEWDQYPKYPLIEGTENSLVEYKGKPKDNNIQVIPGKLEDEKIYPLLENKCRSCIYRELAIEAMEEELVTDSDIDECGHYLNDQLEERYFRNEEQILDRETYDDKHYEDEYYNSTDLFDEYGRMLDGNGNVMIPDNKGDINGSDD